MVLRAPVEGLRVVTRIDRISSGQGRGGGAAMRDFLDRRSRCGTSVIRYSNPGNESYSCLGERTRFEDTFRFHRRSGGGGCGHGSE